MAYFRASSADRWAYFRASIGSGAAYSVRGGGRGACNSQGDRLAAAVVRPSRTGCTGLLSHPFTNPPFHSSCWVERSRRRWCGPVKAEAAGQRRFTGGSRAVYGRSGFVTGALAAVKRVEATKGGPKRPFHDTKRVTAS